MIIINDANPKKDEKGNTIEDGVDIEFHEANVGSINDWIYVINSLIIRSQDIEDKYAYMELLWLLDKTDWGATTLIDVLHHYKFQTIPFLVNQFNKIGRCLSMNKQNRLREVCDSFGQRYAIYHQKQIHEAYETLYPNIHNAYRLNMFELIDNIMKSDKSVDNYFGNQYLLLYKWLHTNIFMDDYQCLKNLFPVVSEQIRSDIVKRYFHDIRNGHTTLDLDLLSQFRDNKFDEFIKYRYCIETPAERVVLTVPLLCDNIITLYNSKGKTFQSFDGILDFAITHCDKAHPGIDFEMKRFLPICQYGAVYNERFKGFIDYAWVMKLDETSLSVKNIRKVIRIILDRYGRRETYYVCKYDSSKKILLKCSNTPDNKCIIKRHGLSCLIEKQYDDRWFVHKDETSILSTFIPSDKLIVGSNDQIHITFEMASEEILKNYVFSLPAKFKMLSNGEFIVPSYKMNGYDWFLIERFFQVLRMRFFPQEGALVGTKFDVFGFKKEIKSQSPQMDENRIKQKCTDYETAEVKKRTIASLKNELGVEMQSDSYFELPYNEDKFVSILNRFYFKKSFSANDNVDLHEFLTSSHSIYEQYCAPQKSPINNPAIDLPYFWCRGKECFHNNLGNQVLAECNDWHNYLLYHLVEIIGYPKLHLTDAGYEPDAVVWNFIAITNKVVQKFRRLKCRSCGHLMFTDKSSGYNRHSWFSCVNPLCKDVGKPVYINFCYHCKKGLIDSRDSAKCPNGWYICPTCLSCCDNAQYKRQAQRYILSNRPVPDGIKEKLGCGHNDKGIYFCPNCGTELEEFVEHGETFRGCPKCRKKFPMT